MSKTFHACHTGRSQCRIDSTGDSNQWCADVLSQLGTESISPNGLHSDAYAENYQVLSGHHGSRSPSRANRGAVLNTGLALNLLGIPNPFNTAILG
eukprot:s3444_g4.t1